MGMRRFTRLTNAPSKKYANHVYALALFFMHYNFVRQHKAHKLRLRWRPASRIAFGPRKASRSALISA